jgi:hypothetical protein
MSRSDILSVPMFRSVPTETRYFINILFSVYVLSKISPSRMGECFPALPAASPHVEIGISDRTQLLHVSLLPRAPILGTNVRF